MPLVRYLTHPQVLIDPSIDVPLWTLSPVGFARVEALAASGRLAGTKRVVSSGETKALRTAEPLASALGATLQVRPAMHENDRSSTGFLPPNEFEAMADAFFAEPNVSVKGWESARAAQMRILKEFEDTLAEPDEGDLLIVGHGAVGTLLYCALAGFEIDRRYDQGPGGGGNWFAFDRATRRPKAGWAAMETL